MRYLFLFILVFAIQFLHAQDSTKGSSPEIISQHYLELMNDYTVNFYTVVNAAEAYFSTVDKSKKGSGWKQYQRWKSLNEYKYYPSGDRSTTAPDFAWKQYQLFIKNNPKQQKVGLNEWQSLGPSSIDSITKHYAVGLGRIEDFYVNPNNENQIYLSSKSGGFWKTNDGGLNWTGGSTDTLMATGVNTFGVSPTNPDSILINIQNAQNEYSHGLYRSTNGGNTWELSNFNPTVLGFGGLGSSFRILDVKYHPRIKDLVFIGTTEGIYRSADNLQSWTRWKNSIGNTYASEITFHPTVDSIIYFAEEYPYGTFNDEIYRSLDSGKTFQHLNTIDSVSNFRVVRLSVSDDCPDCLYYGNNNGVWKSTDRGDTFEFLSNPNEQCHGFAVSNLDTAHMIYGFIDLEASVDGGKSFTQVTQWKLNSTNYPSNDFNESFTKSTNYVHADARNIKYIGNKFYVATDGFLCASDDNGQSWEILSNGTQVRENYKLSVGQGNNARIICGSQDNGSSFRTEKGWVEIYGADGMSSIIHPLNDKYIICSSQNGGRRRSYDGGFELENASPTGFSSADWIAPLLIDPTDHFTIYDFRNAVFKSNDFSETHIKLGEPTSFNQPIKVAAIAENNSDIIIVGYNDRLERSINGGVSFTNIRNGLPSSMIQDIAFDPRNDSVFVVVYGGYSIDNRKIYLTRDLGNSWENISYNLQSIPIRSVAIDHSDSSIIYVGGEIGVYSKSLNGTSWELYMKNLPNVAIRDLEIMYGSNSLRAATWGRGLWETSLKYRASFPSIINTNISSPVTKITPKASVPQFVHAVVSYHDTLSKVYVKWGLNSLSLDSTIEMENTTDSTWVSIKELPRGTEGDQIFFKVYAIGINNDTSETYRFMYNVNVVRYCESKGNSNQYDLFIKNIKLDSWTNSSLNTEYKFYDSISYDVYIDSTYQLTIETNADFESNQFGAWIDYNNDEVFDESERILYYTRGGDSLTREFTIPKHAKVGDTVRLRIRLTRFRQALPCGDAPGEVEDYQLVILEQPKFSFTINSDTLCYGEKLKFKYTGDLMDSIKWTISMGNIHYTSKNTLDSIELSHAGSYQLNLIGFKDGQELMVNEPQIIHQLDTFNYVITTSETSLSLPEIGYNYQWISCTNNTQALQAEKASTFVPAHNGQFAVKISIAHCTLTSDCIPFVSKQTFRVYPNPMDNLLWIETNLSFTEIPFKLYDLKGNLVLKQTITTNRQSLSIEELQSGLYILSYLGTLQKIVKL